MSHNSLRYTLTLVVGRHEITLIERSYEDDEIILDLRVDEVVRGEVRLCDPFLPRVAVSATELAIRGGTEMYLTP